MLIYFLDISNLPKTSSLENSILLMKHSNYDSCMLSNLLLHIIPHMTWFM
jgi:hypothetical protein